MGHIKELSNLDTIMDAASKLLFIIISMGFLTMTQDSVMAQIYPNVEFKTDTIRILNIHVEGKNYLSWVQVSYDIDGTFLVEKRKCGVENFEPCALIKRPNIPHRINLGFWWNEEGEAGCEYRVIMMEIPLWMAKYNLYKL